MGFTRLDKFLANAGIGTRTQVKEQIRRGKVTVDGCCIKEPDYKFDPSLSTVVCDGEVVSGSGYVYFLLHKPAGCVTAAKDDRFPTVMDYLKGVREKELFPVGRLDKDTEGLLLITNDGGLAHNLLSPRKHVDKTYYARIRGQVTEEEVRRFAEGLDIGDEKPTLPAALTVLNSGEESEISLTIREGRYHQVKRMFQAVGMEVLYLKRTAMGPLILTDDLPRGTFRSLTPEEIRKLKG
ncbi:MAG: pseudouridine synthase [Candidatus Limivivens sp.]|nr:pseudouridine synthase [Candidatus Limivivens sp.]